VYAVVDGKAHVQAIRVARQVGSQIVVAEGLAADQQVVVNPPSNLRPESPVELAGAKKVAADKSGADVAKGSRP
jgi:hypothetical protein